MSAKRKLISVDEGTYKSLKEHGQAGEPHLQTSRKSPEAVHFGMLAAVVIRASDLSYIILSLDVVL